jgi:patatin-like phospholipase/acyl hydrolase
MANFRILSCDGGGIRGVLTAVLLDRLSGQYPALLQDSPDTITMYAGTSTGGILALGLAAGLSPAQIRDLYVTNGKLIFDSSWARNVVEIGGLSGSKYDNANLKQILSDTFGARKLKDLAPRVLIASFSLDNQRPIHLSVPGTPSSSTILLARTATANRSWLMSQCQPARRLPTSPRITGTSTAA